MSPVLTPDNEKVQEKKHKRNELQELGTTNLLVHNKAQLLLL